jgi:hypothetical protein
MSATTFEQDERKPSHPIMLTIYRACFLAVLFVASIGALQCTGHMPGQFKFSYVLSNMSTNDQDAENQTAEAKRLQAIQDEAAKHTEQQKQSAHAGKTTVQK